MIRAQYRLGFYNASGPVYRRAHGDEAGKRLAAQGVFRALEAAAPGVDQSTARRNRQGCRYSRLAPK